MELWQYADSEYAFVLNKILNLLEVVTLTADKMY
jgi:hypothetical protein